MENIIQAEQLSRKFGQHLAVDKLTLTLARGEVLALLGTNGAGKTTTLRLLTGELVPTSGSVLVNNIDLNLQPCKAKHLLGYLPDIPPLYGDFTVDEFLYYCASLRNIKKSSARVRIKQVKEFCELQSVSRRLMHKLSKGYQQRVGIAYVILHRPTAVILDEPTNGLDPSQILEMRDLIRSLKDEAGVLLSTHQLNEVDQICDRVQLLKDGATVFCENIDELKRANKIRMRFAGKIPLEDIKSFAEIIDVSPVDTNSVDISASGDLDVLKNSLLAQSQLNKWNLVEVYDIHETLEDIFVTEVLRTKH